MKKKEFTITQDTDLDSLSRKIISYFSTNEECQGKLSDENSDESLLFNLAVNYLDKELASEKDEIARQLKELLNK